MHGGKFPKNTGYLRAPQLLAQHRFTPFIHRMHLKQFFAKSIPTIVIFIADAPIRLSGNQHFHFGTSMPFRVGASIPLLFSRSISLLGRR